MVSTYICTGTVLLFVLVYIPGTSIFFIWGHVHYSCTVHCCCIICIFICVTTAVCVCRTMFVCMALTTGQGCQSCSWSAAEQENELFAVLVRALEFGLARRVRRSHLASACSSPYPRLNLVLAYGISPEFRGGVHSLSVHIMYYECSSAYMYGCCCCFSHSPHWLPTQLCKKIST